MKIFKNISLLILLIIFSSNILAQELERKDIDPTYKWDLSILYKNVDEWKADLNALSKKAEKISDYQGKLDESSQTLYDALNLYFNILQNYYKLDEYASRLSDEDLRIGSNQALTQQANNLGTQISELSSYLNPEILRIDPKKLDQFFNENKKLNEYKIFIDDIQRLRAHTLTPEEEQILASAGMMRNASDIYNIFDNAEMPRPKVTLSTGEVITLNSAGYVRHRADENREDRAKIFKALFEDYGNFQNTIGANYASKIKGDYFFAKNRKYKTCLEASLNVNNIPVSVYENLVVQINKNLPTLYRALDLKKRMLGVDTLHYYDLYTPLVKAVDMHFTIKQGQKILLDVFKPMGKEYVATVKKAFDNRWIDYYPNPGKRSGAYSTGESYAYHPYILTNWTDDYNSLSTLAHELGHTMHSYFSNKNQPFQDAYYATFVAEIASTLNENLLNKYMVDHAKTNAEKLYLLGSYLELLRTTIFRQTSFAEFELDVHKKIENNEPLTGEDMSKIYYNIVKKYYGVDKGVCAVDDYVAHEWEYIPHFVNYTYYVYQYSTSLIYSTAFAQKILTEGQPAVDKYYEILKGGSSDYPINLIKKAGIDPLSSEAFDLTMAKMNSVMDQIEAILDKK